MTPKPNVLAEQAILRSLSHDLKQPIRSIRRRISKCRSDMNAMHVNARLDALDKFMIRISSEISQYRELTKYRDVSFREIEQFVEGGVGVPVDLFSQRVAEAALYPDQETSPEFRENIRFALVHARRFLRRVRSIQHFAGAQGGISPTRFGLHKEAERVLGDIESMLLDREASVTISGASLVVADQIKVGIAIQNLLENAIKYSSPERSPIVEVVIYSLHPGQVDIFHPPGLVMMEAVPFSAPARWAVVEVRDNGRGVKPSEQSEIFEIFRRSPEAADVEEGGTGLGLAIVSHVVSAHHGRVGVDSTLGSGSNFWFMLPQGPGDGDRFTGPAWREAGALDAEDR